MSKILIITGGSKGIGRSLVQVYHQQGYQVYAIARTKFAGFEQTNIRQYEQDLLATDKIEPLFATIFADFNLAEVQKITLINNAGTLGEIGRVENTSGRSFTQTMQLNTLVPMLCSQLFVQHTQAGKAEKTIINITSGAAQKPYFGWAAYCSSKAAIDMFTQVIAVEQGDSGVRVLAIAPGVVDTEMQSQIRAQKASDFKDIDRFVRLKEEGQLAKPADIAQKIYASDLNKSIVGGTIFRIS